MNKKKKKSIRPIILIQPTTMVSDLIEDHRQLALTVYRLLMGVFLKC